MGGSSSSSSSGGSTVVPLKSGDVFAKRYEVIKLLGIGASGAVYLCKDLNIRGLRLALKIINDSILSNPRAISRLQREILSLFTIESDYVVRFYDLVRYEGRVAYTMEYLEGESLASLLSKKKTLSFDFIFRVLTHLVSGLVSVHHAGIVHRDLKPANIVILRQGLAKITDFGLARLEAAEGGDDASHPPTLRYLTEKLTESRATGLGDVVGTPEYMPPEYLLDGRISRQADIYAFGVVAYEMITGKMPFGYCRNLFELATAKIEHTPVPPKTLRPACPDELNKLVSTALDRDCACRYHDIGSLADDLQRARIAWGTKSHAMKSNGSSGPLILTDASAFDQMMEDSQHNSPRRRSSRKFARFAKTASDIVLKVTVRAAWIAIVFGTTWYLIDKYNLPRIIKKIFTTFVK